MGIIDKVSDWIRGKSPSRVFEDAEALRKREEKEIEDKSLGKQEYDEAGAAFRKTLTKEDSELLDRMDEAAKSDRPLLDRHLEDPELVRRVSELTAKFHEFRQTFKLEQASKQVRDMGMRFIPNPPVKPEELEAVAEQAFADFTAQQIAETTARENRERIENLARAADSASEPEISKPSEPGVEPSEHREEQDRPDIGALIAEEFAKGKNNKPPDEMTFTSLR